MYQMARNIHLDHCKQQKRISDIVKDSLSVCEHERAMETAVYVEKDYEDLQVALGKLGPVDRELILLSRFEGLKYHEISKIKNMSEGSIKVQIHRAIKQLKIFYFKQQNT